MQPINSLQQICKETDPLIGIAEQFSQKAGVESIREFGSGNINHTYLVTLESVEPRHFILQRINTNVFRQPGLVMRNMRTFTEHISRRTGLLSKDNSRKWEVPRVLLTRDGQDHWRAPNESFWRAITYIKNSHTFETIQNSGHAKEVGWALGTFHSLLNDLPTENLSDTLEGFHITPLYLKHYDRILEKYKPANSPQERFCEKFVGDRRKLAGVLEDAKSRGELPLRPIHGDPKVNNIMIDKSSNQAVSIVDLDTVKPGLIHYDIGDCLRSGCNPSGEETSDWENVVFDGDTCRAILQGFLSVAREFLTDHDYDFLFDAIRLIAFELGLRFFTDHIEGNVYFKARHPGHNLARALVQFKLCESIESQEKDIRALVRSLR